VPALQWRQATKDDCICRHLGQALEGRFAAEVVDRDASTRKTKALDRTAGDIEVLQDLNFGKCQIEAPRGD